MPYLIAGGILVVLLVAFVWWRYTSVARGAAQRDARIFAELDPLGNKLLAKQPVTPGEVAALARKPHLRQALHALLEHVQRLDLFPPEHLAVQAEAEANLARWMMHPNELQDPPEAIELVETVRRTLEGREGRFLVFRYRMPKGHWAGEGWLLGFSGPHFADIAPYDALTGAFSRCSDKHGEIQPAEIVDWYIDLVERKSRQA
jgi:hypothetical protein